MEYACSLFRVLARARVNECTRGGPYASFAAESWIFPKKATLKVQ